MNSSHFAHDWRGGFHVRIHIHKTLTVSVQDQRVNVNVDAKQSIARAALELVRDGDTVFVDSGTRARRP